MKYALLILVGVIVLGGIWFLGQTAELPKKDSKTTPTATINGHELNLEVMRESQERSRGLSQKELLAENAGMLFIFESPGVPGFWMKDMNFSIDIIWIGSHKRVVDITENLAPETFPEVFKPKAQIQYVLEVNAGWVDEHNISIGDTILTNNVF